MTRRVPEPARVRAGYDRAAAGYDQRRQSHKKRARFARIDAPQLAIAQNAARVLEIGCGTGRLLAQAKAHTRVGIDLSTAMLAGAAGRGIFCAAADAHALPFASESFDAILAGNAVFRYLDYSRAFAECARVLQPGGRLAVHQYAARTWRLFGHNSDQPLHLRNLAELIQPAAGAGLCTEKVTLLRALRFWPYVVPVPAWLGGDLWSHATVIFRKPG